LNSLIDIHFIHSPAVRHYSFDSELRCESFAPCGQYIAHRGWGLHSAAIGSSDIAMILHQDRARLLAAFYYKEYEDSLM